MQNTFEPFSRIRLIPVAVETGLIAGWPVYIILLCYYLEQYCNSVYCV